MIEIQPYQNADSVQEAVTDALCRCISEATEQRGRCTISLSGGSTPRRVYEMLAGRDLPWDQVHLFWGDERNVPPDHADSNFRMVRNALLDRVDLPQANVHAVAVDVDAPAEAASQYEQTIVDHFGGPPRWDLVLLGMGDDAHTASLFPHTKALAVSDRWFVENWVPKFDAYRYTMTYRSIEAAEQIWFIITGSNKSQALRHVLAGEGDADEFPSRKIRPTRWFVDREAAGDLA